jgi:UDP-N-acetylglucosamine 2-epimerase (non-hydrolysing)
VRVTLVHSGQHYDPEMSGSFFEELGLPQPDVNLGVAASSHAEQVGRVLIAMESLLLAGRPDLLVVVGDGNSTFAGALAAVKLGIPVAHVEAGLRSGDRTMPEEINRILTDQVSDLLFTPSPDADRNLAGEGIPAARVRLVGNIMIDTLLANLPAARAGGAQARHGVAGRPYALATLHRPSNVDDADQLAEIFAAFDALAGDMPVLLPLHPRTRRNAESFGLRLARATVLPPLGYHDMLALMAGAALVLTDSGGVQEETTGLGVPCMTLRGNTERPITIVQGTNTLVPVRTRAAIMAALDGALAKRGRVPDLWDGRTAGRIVDEITAWAAAR